MSEQSLHHRYDINDNACMYCGKPWHKINDRWCITLEEAVDMWVERAHWRQLHDPSLPGRRSTTQSSE